ncbi:flavin reductase family protein [Actinomyces sp.]|uniref:flavin reductase family protein n=1 Tax=Actinomyces sp. TaxID=29317 RepID=UPI0026DC6195|nr:flavin reductase family protein [Actinomyces sp.]MDO4900095.1 flavin reductase family protein [Actinomyces sp.]
MPPQPTSPVGPEALRRTLASFPTGIVLVTGQDYNSTPVGMLANSFTSVSLDPPLVSLAFARSSSTWPLLRYASLLRISVLGTQLAGPTAQRFVGLECALRGEDAALLGSPATLSAVPERIIEAGDHDLALLRVLEVEQDGEIGPLVLYARRLHRLAI